MGLLDGSDGKESACNGGNQGQSSSWEDLLEKGMAPTPEILPREFRGQRSLKGYSPGDHKESDMTKHADTTLQDCSSDYWIFQSRILEWIAFPYSRRACQTGD